MKLRPYEKVAIIYDAMMKKLDYESWSNYILEIADEYIDDKATVLELGAGSCKIAAYISSRYKNYYETDISLSMLKSSGVWPFRPLEALPGMGVVGLEFHKI